LGQRTSQCAESARADRQVIDLSARTTPAWRRASFVARPRAVPIALLAALSYTLVNGFFLTQGFLMTIQCGLAP